MPAALILAAAFAASAPFTFLAPGSPVSAYPSTTVEISGHGYGHGIGMGQWGALGYAIAQDGGAGNFTYQQILSHYYGNTSLETLGSAGAPAAADGGDVRVAMTENNGNSLIATASGTGVTVPGTSGDAPAVMIIPNSSFTSFSVYTGPGCAGPWSGPVAGPLSTATTAAPGGGPIDLCEAAGPIEVHGTLTALFNSIPSSRVVNTLPLEQYVADVAPAESPSSWAGLGGSGPQGQSWGFQESEAQTVAARSYVESSPLGYGGYADTCDQTCQSYPGMADENATSLLAAQDTAGEVMVDNGTTTVADTEYSASTGGYTQGDQFPAVEDAGDAVCIPGSVCNPDHDWTVEVPVTTIQSAYPQIGTLSSITITARNGNGDYGGRVDSLTITGTSGTATDTGSGFASAVGLMSNWFTLGPQPGGSSSGGGGGSGTGGGLPGYWMDTTTGGVYPFGGAQSFGNASNLHLNRPIVGMAPTPDGNGYWLVATDGGVFSYGDAHFFGSTGALHLNKPVVGMAGTADGGGYWLVASDGGVFTFGDAQYWGSTGAIKLNKPIVGMVPTRDGGGYWLVASDGGVFTFGDATFHGSLGADPPSSPVVDVAPTPDGGGYWMLEADGTVVGFGSAQAESLAAGSPAPSTATAPMTSLIPTPDGGGYVMVDAAGQAFSFGDAPYDKDVAGTVAGFGGDVVGIAAS